MYPSGQRQHMTVVSSLRPPPGLRLSAAIPGACVAKPKSIEYELSSPIPRRRRRVCQTVEYRRMAILRQTQKFL